MVEMIDTALLIRSAVAAGRWTVASVLWAFSTAMFALMQWECDRKQILP